MSRVTIADVAREAGVSLMTVSRALNNKDGISLETRAHVLEVIQRMGYRPSGVARSLVTRRTGTIGLIVPDVSNPYFSGIAHGVAEVANQNDLSVLLCDTEEQSQQEIEFLQVLEEKQVDGVIVAAPRHSGEQLIPQIARHQNVVVVNRVFQNHPGFNASGYVINDDYIGGRLATCHLLNSGHKRIGFLGGPRSSYGSQRRLQGYKAVLEEAGIPYKEKNTIYCHPTVKGGFEAILALLEVNPKITSVFCFNDMVAIGALQATVQYGLKVPDDLAIVGYDDIPMASWVTPTLTTCRAPFEEMGRLATRLLIDRFQDCTQGCGNIELQPELIIRASAP